MFLGIHEAAVSLGLFQQGSELFEAHGEVRATKWIRRKLTNSSMTDLAMRILETGAFSLLWGFRGIRDRICAWALWRLGPSATIKGLQRDWPSKVFLSCHHRRTSYESDLCAQFLVSYFYTDFKVITDLKKPSAILGPISTYLYNDTSINELPSEERHWALARIMQEASDGTVVSTFPDRCGSQFYGDQGMVFRPGLFAASVFTGVPIVDVCIVEPTESVDSIHIVFTEWTPPERPKKHGPGATAADYTTWRSEHADLVKDFAQTCERDFKQRLHQLEQSKATCGTQPDECDNIKHVDFRVLKAMERNNNASKYVFASK